MLQSHHLNVLWWVTTTALDRLCLYNNSKKLHYRLNSFISACCASSTITVHSTHVDLSLLRLLSVLFKTSMKVHEELSGSSPRQISVRGNSPTMAQNHDSRLAHLVVLIQYWSQHILLVEPPTHWTPLLKAAGTCLDWLWMKEFIQITLT